MGVGLPVLSAGLGSALFFAVSSVCKHISAGHGPAAPQLRPGAIARFALATVRHPLWLAGILADTAGLGLQIVALHLGALSVVQPLMLSGLVFAILLRGAVSRKLPLRQAWWALVVAAALGSFLVLASGGSLPAPAAVDRLPALLTALGGLGLVAATLWWGTRATVMSTRAALTGVAAGTIYAATAALIKTVSNLALQGFVPLVGGWQLYALILVGATGLLVGQIAFGSGPMAAALPVASTVDPLLSVGIGIAIYDERLQPGPAHGVVLVLLVIVLCLAVVRLVRLGDGGSGPHGGDARGGVEKAAAVVERVDVPLAAQHQPEHR